MCAAYWVCRRSLSLPLDGFVVYDLQDESSRTAAPRPFPFVPTVDSRGYSRRLGELTGKSAVCYKCIAHLSEAEWLSWLRESIDYTRDCRERGVPPRRVILTFAPCARAKTIAFMRWLGIAVPHEIEQAIVTAPAPLSKSIDICRANLRQILNYVDEDLLLGVNAECLSINRDEIDASTDLFLAPTEAMQSWPGARAQAT